jgi:hypothetical protein
MTPQQVLQGAIDLISDPNKWCSLAGARDVEGEPVDVHDKNAVCWCAIGAINKVAGRNIGLVADTADLFYAANNGRHITDINDFDGRQAVIDAMKHAL